MIWRLINQHSNCLFTFANLFSSFSIKKLQQSSLHKEYEDVFELNIEQVHSKSVIIVKSSKQTPRRCTIAGSDLRTECDQVNGRFDVYF